MSGRKDDQHKARLDLLPTDALLGVAEVLRHGAQVYGDRNWEKGIDYSRLYAAALRHLFAWWNGEDVDAESGLQHIDHALCSLLFLSALAKRSGHLMHDDRPLRMKFEEE